MNILMLSIDKLLVGGDGVGNAVPRHREYGTYVDRLDIIVHTKKSEDLDEYKISDNVKGIPSNSSSKAVFFFDAVRIAKEINKKNKIDLVVCQDPFILGLAGWWIKVKLGAKLQLNFHGDFWDNPNWLKERRINRLFHLISQFTIPRADAIRVMSPGQKEKLIKKGIDEKKIRVISTPVDLARFEGDIESDKVRDIKKRVENKKIILMVGRKDQVKGFDILFKAMEKVVSQYSDACLWLVGNYSQDEVDKMEVSKRVMVIASGNIAPEDLPVYYSAAKIIVLSSYSESFGKVLVEAGAAGKAVVSTATTGAKEIVEDGRNGYLVPVGDSEAMADKIIYLLNNPEKGREMGEAGRRMVREKYSNNTEKVVEFWQDTVSSLSSWSDSRVEE